METIVAVGIFVQLGVRIATNAEEDLGLGARVYTYCHNRDKSMKFVLQGLERFGV